MVDKFSSLVILISRTIFLTMASMAVPDEEKELFESELSFHTAEEGGVESLGAKKIKI